MDIRSDLLKAIFHGEMTRLQAVHFGLRKVLQVCFAALPGEEYVVLSPEIQRLRLLLAEKILPLRLQLNVLPVIVKKVHLHTACIGSLHESEIHVPVVRADSIGVLVTMQIHGLDCLEFE